MKWTKTKLFGGMLLFLILLFLFRIFAAQIDSALVLAIFEASALSALLIAGMVYHSRKMRGQLRKESDHLRQILNHIPQPLFIIDEKRNLRFVNAAALGLFQCEKDMVGMPCNCFKTCICDTPECVIDKMEQTGDRHSYYEMDGKSYMVSTALLGDGTAQDSHHIEVIQDITKVVEAQKALEEKTVELETMSENLIGGILITAISEDFPVIRCNKGYREMVGKREKQIVGKPAMRWVVPEDAAKLNEKIQTQLANGDKVNAEQRLHFENGAVRWISVRGKRTVLRDQQVGVWILTDISGAKEVELALRVDEERYRIAMQNTEDIVIDYDMKTHVMYHSSKAKEIYNVPEIVENMPQSILDSGTVLEESKNEYLDLFRQLSEGVEKCSCILRARAADGRILWNRLTFTAIFDDDGSPIRAIGILQDITREKNTEIQYKREARYLALRGKEDTFYYEADVTRRCFLSGHEAIVQAYCDPPTDDFDTVKNLLLAHMVYEPDRELVDAHINREALMRDYNAGLMHTSFEYRRDTEGGPMWMDCAIQCFFDVESESVHFVGCIRDINEMKQREHALQKKAERDLLTGLYNKVTTELFIKNLTDSTLRDKATGAFLLIDLDSFKNVNDTLGHAFGDAVLSEVSRGLLSLFRQSDVVGRIGGDEFVAYMDLVDNEAVVTEKAQQICHMFHSMYAGANNNYKISGTIGIAIFPAHGKNFDELYKNADRALYYAKERGKDNFAVFTQDLPSADYGAISPRGIDANAGKLFAENISEYILRILYESADSSRAICAILELLSKHFGFSRGYVFEVMDGRWDSTYAWCAEETRTPVAELLKFPWQVLENNGGDVGQAGIFTISSADKGEEAARLATQGVHSLVWFSAMNNGVLQAMIGFDNCVDERKATQEDIAVLRQAGMLIGLFIMNARSKENLNNPSIAAERVMDSIENVIYVVDPNDFSLCYLNRKTRIEVPSARLGAKCYKALCGRDEPCENCSLRLFLQGGGKKMHREIVVAPHETKVDVTVSKILWQDGKEYCLVECIERR